MKPLTLAPSLHLLCSKAAVNAPQSRRFAKQRATRQTQSVWTAVASAPLWTRKKLVWLSTCLVAFHCCITAYSAETNSNASQPEPKDLTHVRIINERVNKIVAPLGIADAAKSNRIHEIIVKQYGALSDVHLVRDAQIQNARSKSDKTNVTAAVQAARDEAKSKTDKLHAEFLTKLAAELSLEQVDEVKNGLTYHVLPGTYGVYLKMYPELTDEQKAQIKSWLTEARELAMDGSTSDEKHAVFGKYKGKINNYLSKAGYDAKKAEQNLKKPTTPASDSQVK